MSKLFTAKRLQGAIAAFALCASSFLANGAEKVTFTAACLNVDGLPSLINSDGPGSSGSKKISQAIYDRGWDFVGLSEDFNYHTEIISAISDSYYIGTYRGEVGLSTLVGTADTDGLCFLSKKAYPSPMGTEYWETWRTRVGSLTHGADEKILKGFRYYCMELAEGYKVDVYILHMNSESDQPAIDAKHDEIAQLLEYILDPKNDHKRPIIIMGDTNCRYTRESVKELLIDRVNNVDRYLIEDPWIKYSRGGIYPPCPSASIMVDDFGYQIGEVVDKVFYINDRESGVKLTANNYYQDENFRDESGTPLADHFPIAITFTIEEYEYDPDKPLEPDPSPEVQTYFLLNVGTGKYLNQGLTWGTHAMVGDARMRVTFTPTTGGYTLSTPAGALMGEDVYVDSNKAEDMSRVWSLTKVSGSNSYTLGHDGLLLGVTNESTGLVNCENTSATPLFQWELVPEVVLIEDLSNATQCNPKDATFRIFAADFPINSNDYYKWKITSGSKCESKQEGIDKSERKDFVQRFYNGKKGTFESGFDSKWSMKQEITNLPAGVYNFYCDAVTSVPKSVYFLLNSERSDMAGYKTDEKERDISALEALELFDAGGYNITKKLIITDGKLNIDISKEDNSSKTTTCFDNFRLTYLGDLNNAFDNRYDLLAKSNFYTPEAYKAYKDSTDNAKAAYADGSLKVITDDPYAYDDWQADVDCSNLLMSAFGTTNDFSKPLYVNTWSTEGYTDGSDFKVPFYEYFTDNNSTLANNTFTASVDGMVPGRQYTVIAQVRVEATYNAKSANGIYMQVGNGEKVDITKGKLIANPQGMARQLGTFAAVGKADENGKLTVNFIVEGSNVHWLAFKSLRYLEPNEFEQVDALSDAPNVYISTDEGNKATAIILTDAETYANDKTISADEITYTRHYGHANWQALCLPVTVDFDQIKEYAAQQQEVFQIIEFSGVETDEQGFPYLTFTRLQHNEDTQFKAHTPYLFKPAVPATGVVLDDKGRETFDLTFEFTGNPTLQPYGFNPVAKENWMLIGNYEPVNGLNSERSYVVSSGDFYRVANDQVELNPFRIRLIPNTNGDANDMLKIKIEDGTESITSVVNDAWEDGVFYNLQGIPVDNPTPGFYIFNGTKVLIK